MADQQAVKIGVEAPCPVGPNAPHQVHYFDIEERTVENMRNISGSERDYADYPPPYTASLAQRNLWS